MIGLILLASFTKLMVASPLGPIINAGKDGIRQDRQDKIAGGYNATIDLFPWQLGLVFKNNPNGNIFCGASMIGDRYALTAGHCFHSLDKDGKDLRFSPNDLLVISNTDSLDNIRNRTPIMATSDLNRFNPRTFDNDVVVLKTRDRLAGNVIKLMTQFDDPLNPGDETYTSGFGNIYNDGKGNQVQSRNLRYYAGSIQPNIICQNQYQNYNPNKMICVGPDGGAAQGDCAGDSGGPIVTYRRSASFTGFMQIGTVSFGARPCGAPNRPSVEAKVSSQLSFIQQQLRNL